MPIPASPRAVVTGAGSGLGRAFCMQLARRGARRIAADIDHDTARATAALLVAAGAAEAHAAHADVARFADVEALGGEAERLFGGVDLVINNAGVAVGGNVGAVPMAEWRRIVGINLMGVVHGCEVFVPGLRQQGSGHVLNIASAAGLLCTPRMGPYNTTKAAVVALSETLYGELLGSGAGCTVLCPTFFPTNVAQASTNVSDREKAQVEKLMRRSRLSADDVAAFALRSCDAGELYSLPHADGRWLWRLKRAMPARFYQLAPKLMARLADRLDRA